MLVNLATPRDSTRTFTVVTINIGTTIAAFLIANVAFGTDIGALKRFERIDSQQIRATPSSALDKGAEASKRIELEVSAFGRTLLLSLAPAPVISKNCIVQQDTPTGMSESPCKNLVYRGSVSGMPDASVRAVIDDGNLDLRIETPETIYWIEPESRFRSNAPVGSHLAYLESDVEALIDTGDQCATFSPDDERSKSVASSPAGSLGKLR